MLEYDNVTLDIENVPHDYKLRDTQVSAIVDTIKAHGNIAESIAKKESMVRNGLAAIVQDLKIVADRLHNVGKYDDEEIASDLCIDIAACQPMCISKAVDLAKAIVVNPIAEPDMYPFLTSVMAMYRGDLRVCIRDWQIWNALERISCEVE